MPEEVLLATKEYRQESDILGAFIEDRCALDPAAATPAAALYQAYKDWAKTGEEYLLSQTKFGRQLADRGITADKRGHGNTSWRIGIRLLDAGQLSASSPTDWNEIGEQGDAFEPEVL